MRLTKNEIQTEPAGRHGDLRRSDLNLHNLPLKYLSYNKDLSVVNNSLRTNQLYMTMSVPVSSEPHIRCEDRTGKRGTFGWYKREISILKREP
jgi:hypothetical protein